MMVPHLTQDGLGLHADALHAVHHHQGSVSDTQGCSDLAGEVDVPGGVDEVDEVVIAVALLGEALQLLVLNLVVQRDTCASHPYVEYQAEERLCTEMAVQLNKDVCTSQQDHCHGQLHH